MHKEAREELRVRFKLVVLEFADHLQADLDAWLVYYNTERPHQGYRNMGRRPIEAIELFTTKPASQSPKLCGTMPKSTSWPSLPSISLIQVYNR